MTCPHDPQRDRTALRMVNGAVPPTGDPRIELASADFPCTEAARDGGVSRGTTLRDNTNIPSPWAEPSESDAYATCESGEDNVSDGR